MDMPKEPGLIQVVVTTQRLIIDVAIRVSMAKELLQMTKTG
jgi:hypothetical protein